MKGNYDKAEALLENCTSYKTFTFPETIFTAVTAYQNQLVKFIIDIGYVKLNIMATLVNYLFYNLLQLQNTSESNLFHIFADN